MPNRYDVSINSIEYRLVRGEDGYKQGASRAMIDFQEIETMQGSQFSSREDVRSMFQTSWGGGSRWEKPLLSSESIDSYYTSDDFDMLVEPGSLLPNGIPVETTYSTLTGHSKWVQADYRTAYCVADSGGTYWDIMQWQDGTLSNLTDSNIDDGDTPIDLCWDDQNATLFLLSTAGVEWYTPGTATEGNVDSTVTGSIGSTVFMHQGELHVWDSDQLYKITDPLGTPDVSDPTIFNDGFGPDWLTNIDLTGDRLFPWSCRLAISTADGIYLVKNVAQSGTTVAYIYRVDRDASGTNIGTPVATLAPGTVALDIFWHLGSLIVAGANDIGRVGANDASEPAPRVTFYHLTQNSLGTIGSATGNEPEEFVFKMLYTVGPTLYIGGAQNVWAYDAVRGGLHMLHETSLTDGHYSGGFLAGNGLYFGHGGAADEQVLVHLPYAHNTTSGVTADLESNYFDFSIPGEQKYVTECTLMTSGIEEDETWTVYLESDDGAFALVATFASGNTSKATFSFPVAGYRFRYRLLYSTSSAQATPSKVKGILFRALSGEMVPVWQLMIDGTEARNVENEIVRPEDVFDNLKALRDDKTPVTLIDNYESDDRSDTASYQVRVQSVNIIKEEPKESVAQVVLVGV